MKGRGKQVIKSNGSSGRYAIELNAIIYITLTQMDHQGQEIKYGTPTSFDFHQFFFEDEVNWASDSLEAKVSLVRSDDNEAPNRVTKSMFAHLFHLILFMAKLISMQLFICL